MLGVVKNGVYQWVASFLRWYYSNRITGKRIKGTSKILYYEISQHLGFLGRQEILYEADFCRILLAQIKPGSVVFEIGSNIGQYSLQISEKIGKGGRLICVEPDTDNFALLQFNVRKNKCSNVTLLQLAVSNEGGPITMFKDSITGGRMSSMIKKYSNMRQDGETEQVEAVTLKSLMRTYGNPSFVKVDVEGAENFVFSDIDDLHSNTIYIVEVREETKEDVFLIFNKAGFTCRHLEGNQRLITAAALIPDFANLLFIPKALDNI